MKRVKFSISLKSEKKQREREREIERVTSDQEMSEAHWGLDLRSVALCCVVLCECSAFLACDGDWRLERERERERERREVVELDLNANGTFIKLDTTWILDTWLFVSLCGCVSACWMISITRAIPRDNLNK